MAQTAVFQTYGDLTIKTDIVLDSVEIISAREDGIFAMLGKTNAIAMIHSYPVDTLLTPASQAVEQGQDFTYLARTSPTLLTNIVEEIAIPIRVTRPQIAVQHYHGQNELDRQLAKGLMEFTNAVELISQALLKPILINGEHLRLMAKATLNKAICQLQRLNEMAPLMGEATVRTA